MERLFYTKQKNKKDKNYPKAKVRIVIKVSQKKKYDPIIISDAVYSSDHKIQIFFKDESIKIIDFKPFIFDKYVHPIYKRYRKVSVFKKFKIKNGNLNWYDYEMIFPVEQLYAGKIN